MRRLNARYRATFAFKSMGGTSLIFTSAAFGMILSVSHTFSEEGEREEREKQRIKSEKLRKRAKDIEEDIEEEYGEREPVYQNE